MKILHISDTHGSFDPLKLEGVDVIVHSGDFFPDFDVVSKERSREQQRDWFLNNRDNFDIWREKKTFLYVPGNHDFAPIDLIEDLAIDAHRLGYIPKEIDEVTFIGFRYVPWINGYWNNELRKLDMRKMYDEFVDIWDLYGGADVLVTHAPAHGVLDNERQRYGCTTLRNVLDYEITRKPLFHLHGHIHEANGFWVDHYGDSDFDFTVTSNAATTQHWIYTDRHKNNHEVAR